MSQFLNKAQTNRGLSNGYYTGELRILQKLLHKPRMPQTSVSFPKSPLTSHSHAYVPTSYHTQSAKKILLLLSLHIIKKEKIHE